MKDYKNFMDKVKLDPELQEKIANGEIRRKPKHGAVVLRFAAAAASIVALLAVVLMIPGINQAAHDGYENIHAEYAEEVVYSYAPEDEFVQTQAPLYDSQVLTFNTAYRRTFYRYVPEYTSSVLLGESEARNIFIGINSILHAGEYDFRRLYVEASLTQEGVVNGVGFFEPRH